MGRPALPIRDLDQQRVAAAKHVGDDPAGADALGLIRLVEADLRVASTDGKNADLSLVHDVSSRLYSSHSTEVAFVRRIRSRMLRCDELNPKPELIHR